MGTMSIWHWVVVLAIVALVFGPSRLGQMGKGLGEGIRNLRKGLSGEDDEPKKLDSDSASKPR
jgi:sec-independent protein translocase protein TatA